MQSNIVILLENLEFGVRNHNSKKMKYFSVICVRDGCSSVGSISNEWSSWVDARGFFVVLRTSGTKSWITFKTFEIIREDARAMGH